MTSISPQGWTQWLNTHATRQAYDDNPSKVTDLCTGASAAEKFDKLSNSKNIVLLSRAPIGKKLQATFFHSVIGIPILPDDLHFVARSGMKHGTGVELDPDSLLSKTAAIRVPKFLTS